VCRGFDQPSLREIKHDLAQTAFVLKMAAQMLSEPTQAVEVVQKVTRDLSQEASTLDHIVARFQCAIDDPTP
jgi:hypothetical protein